MHVEKLLSIASSPIVTTLESVHAPLEWQGRGERFGELFHLLSACNGFYAFEAALHVFPWKDSVLPVGCIGLQQWNERELWRNWYEGVVDDEFFFAEDAFGGQFAIRGEEIVSFDPESGEIETLAESLEDWARQLLSNYAQLTGYPLANAWQVANGPIPLGKRLLPKTPFLLGGEYSEENLYAVDAVKGMRYRGELWQQLRDLPDGAQVRLKPLPTQ